MINLQDTVITELTKYYENFDKDSAEYISAETAGWKSVRRLS